VDQSAILANPQLANDVEELAKSHGFEFTRVGLDSLFQGQSLHLQKGEYVKSDETLNMEAVERLQYSLQQCASMSAQEDLFSIYTMRCLFEEAKRLDCNVLALGDNATHLALRAISQTSKGRGWNLPGEVALSTVTSFGMHVMRPLKDHLAKEIEMFNDFQGLVSFPHHDLTAGMDKKTSINSMTADFILGLQDELPSTVSTISRTAFKIPSLVTSTTPSCLFCLGYPFPRLFHLILS